MVLSIIVAAARNQVIGRDNGLVWHLSADLKRFKALTTGHTIVMGRKTFESIGRALPNRRNVVISGNPSFQVEGCEVVNSVEAALDLVSGDEKVFIIGGGSIYKHLWDQADYLYLTRVCADVEGDTVIPEILEGQWKEVRGEHFQRDEKNDFDYSFIDYERIR